MMSKKMIKIICIIMAVLMILSVGAVALTAFTADASAYQEIIPAAVNVAADTHLL